MTATNDTTKDTSEFSLIVRSTDDAGGIGFTTTTLAFGNVIVGSVSASQSSTLTLDRGPRTTSSSNFDTSSLCYGGPICTTGGFMCRRTA